MKSPRSSQATPAVPSAHPSEERLYFGYGSNLWRRQMALRCPASRYVGVARLDGYRWIINARGYANVVQTDDAAGGHCVWGAVYELPLRDEAALDVNEGVPVAYTKEELAVWFWRGAGARTGAPERVSALVYIDRTLVEDGEVKREYVERMNQGINDALAGGVPQEYVQKELRRFIPAPVDASGEDVSEFALRQAQQFVDED